MKYKRMNVLKAFIVVVDVFGADVEPPAHITPPPTPHPNKPIFNFHT